MAENTLDISWGTILKVLIAGLLFYGLFLARDIALWFFWALAISLLLEPAIIFLRKLKLPRFLSAAIVYLAILAVIGILIYFTAPIFVFELSEFSQNIPQYFEKINPFLKEAGIEAAASFETLVSGILANLKESSSSIFRALIAFFGGISAFFVILTLAFFISLEDRAFERFLALLAPKKHEHQVSVIFERVQAKVSGWFGARILSCVVVAALSLIVFSLFGVKFAFTLALISGVLNFVPYIGPTITLALSVLFVGTSGSWWQALYVGIFLLVIQEIDNKFLTPFLMKKFIDLPPALVLISLLAGSVIFGFFGALFAVPIAGIIFEFLKEYLEKKKEGAILSE